MEASTSISKSLQTTFPKQLQTSPNVDTITSNDTDTMMVNNDLSSSIFFDFSTTSSSLSYRSTTSGTHSITTNNALGNDSTTGLSHNMTSEQIRNYLNSLQEEEILLFLPVLIFLIIIAVSGFFGNILVLLVYKSKFHRTPTRIFIMVIAMFDLISNVLCIPCEIYDIFHLWEFPILALCQLNRYANAATTITSACILLALSITRFRKICRPFGKQVSTRHAKIMSIGIAIFGWTASIPFGILNGMHARPTPRDGIYGYECSIADSYVDTIWPLINSAFFLLLFLVLCGPLVVLYTLIGVQAYKHSHMHGRSMVNMKTTATATMSVTEDNLDATSVGSVLSRFLRRKKAKTYEITNSEFIDSDENTKSRENVAMSVKSEAFKMHERKGTPAETRRNDSDPDNKVTSPGGDQDHVNFSMVRELTCRLKDIKDNENSSSLGELENEGGNDETADGMSETLIADGNNKISDLGANDSTNLQDPTETGINDSDSDHEMMSPRLRSSGHEGEDSEKRESKRGLESKKGLASRLQWIDITYCLYENDENLTNDKESSETPTKSSTSVSRKVSRENSLLQKQRRFRETLAETLIRVRRIKKEDAQFEKEDNEGVDGDESNNDKVNDRNNERKLSQMPEPVSKAAAELKKNKHDSAEDINGVKSTGVKMSHLQRNSIINRTTAMLILITSTYVLSYIPYLVLIFFRFIQPENYRNMGDASLTTHHFFLRTYFINSAANCIIYSICDKKFRKEAVSLFRCRE